MSKQLFRMERLLINRSRGIFQNIRYFSPVLQLYLKYLRNLEDDFSIFQKNPTVALVELLERTFPHFYLILAEKDVCGFFCLENFVGTANNIYSAQVVTCFTPKYWGKLTKFFGKFFRDYCFEKLGIQKIKALVYPQNSRVRAMLRACGFKKEALLKSETMKDCVKQDVEIYSVMKEEKCN